MTDKSPTTPAPPHNPYPGLRPFRSDEKHLFFGRERQVDRMVEKLAAHRFLAVVGGSGSGKSSLVNCGLRPALHRGNMANAGSAWRMAQMRPGNDPVGALARALGEPGVLFDEPLNGALSTAELVETTLRLGSLGLVDMVEQADLPPGTNLLVVADQFEELFRFRNLLPAAVTAHSDAYTPPEDALAFVALLLAAAAQTTLPIYVVLTMRSDFLGDCAQFDGLPEAINEGQYLVPRLTRSEIRAAITGPAAVAGRQVSPMLVTRLLNDVGDNPDQLSILQHALNRTWAYWGNEGGAQGELELQHYLAIGGMAQALDRHANKAYGELGSTDQQDLAAQVFKALTDKTTDARGTRRPTRFATLSEITAAAPEELEAVFAVFRKPSRSFLMPPLGEALTPETVIDISHESLMRVWKRLSDWGDAEARSAGIYTRLAERAARHAMGKADFYTQLELDEALSWRAEEKPTAAWAQRLSGNFEQAMEFLDDSNARAVAVKAEGERKRRVRAVGVGLALAVMVAFSANWVATESSRLNQRRADADGLLRDIAFAAHAYAARTNSTGQDIGCKEYLERRHHDAELPYNVDLYRPLLDDLCAVAPPGGLSASSGIDEFLGVAAALQEGDLALAGNRFQLVTSDRARFAAESMIDELVDLQTPEIAHERRLLHALDTPSDQQNFFNKVRVGGDGAEFKYRHPVHRRISMQLRNSNSFLSESEKNLLGAYGSLDYSAVDPSAAASGDDPGSAADATSSNALATVSDNVEPTSGVEIEAEATALFYGEAEMHERMLHAAGQPESAFAELQRTIETWAAAFFALLVWPIWKGWRHWRLHRGTPIASKPGATRSALAALVDLTLAGGLVFAVYSLTDSTLSIGKWLALDDAEGVAALVGLVAGLAYWLLRDAIRLRYCRSIGKVAFDLRPVHVKQMPRGHIGVKTSMQRNWPLLVSLLLGLTVMMFSPLFGVPVLGAALWLTRHTGDRRSRTQVIDSDSNESRHIEMPPRYIVREAPDRATGEASAMPNQPLVQ